MGTSLRVYIVDDSAVQTEIARALLEKAGHAVTTSRSSAEALRDIPSSRPDCVLMDIMMPEIDGYELCRRLRAMPALARTTLLMMSTKAYPFERKRAFELGASGYFTKPLHPASFAAQIERLVAGTLTMTFWGVRGTLPISRKDSLRCGGATSCMSLDFPDGRLFVFDAGSGIKSLSGALTTARRTRIEGKILISHPHWDHINALPFFAPFYAQGNQFEICGASHGDISMRALISAQMDGVFFPVTVREFAADVTYRDLGEGEFEIGGVTVRTMLLRHPGNCLGFRLQHAGRSICYVTDNEVYDPDSEFYSDEYVERLTDFARDAVRADHRLLLHGRGVQAEDGLGSLLGQSSPTARSGESARAGVDQEYVRLLLESLGAEKVCELIGELRRHACPQRDRLLEARARADLGEMRAAAHALTGMAANLGLTALAELTGAIEEACRQGRIGEAAALTGRVQTGLERALAELEALDPVRRSGA
jgi:CheY-like chemotaxis protein/HPt (histidine-containing phosphotransfer) domain-containing protein